VPHAACHPAGQVCAEIVPAECPHSAYSSTYLVHSLGAYLVHSLGVPPAAAVLSGIGSHAAVTRQGAHQG
jgi:hypothetical protein